MMRYKLTIAYDGTGFAGFQIQPRDRTVQGELEKSLKTMTKGINDKVHGSGRTDSGVHALGQVVHYDYPGKLSEKAMFNAMNTLLPDDIVVQKVERVDSNFHSRFSAKEKTYIYRLYNGKTRNPFTRAYAYWHPYPLDITRLREALTYIEGEYDFTSFASTKDPIENKVRSIYEARVDYDYEKQEFIFLFRGNGFLYNMIRVLMGTLIEIGDGRREPKEMQRLLEVKDRNQAGPTASPLGLYLKSVAYY